MRLRSVHSLDGPWLAQPFWRSRLLLTSGDQVDALRRSGVPAVVIDLNRCVPPAKAPAQGVARNVPDRYSAARRSEDFKLVKRITDDARRVMKTVFEDVRDGKCAVLEDVDAVVGSMEQALDRNRSMLLNIMRLKQSDEYTYYHSVSVGTLMINFARELGLSDDQVKLMALGGLLHDIGKTRISKCILKKPARLTTAEFDEMRKHPVLGYELLASRDIPATVLDVCLHHHEKMDGSGYPFGLAGNDISLAARMGAICDVYDAMTSKRPYKDAASPIAVVQMMASWSGHFDPQLLFVFMKSIGVFPVGMLVRLSSGQLAVARDNGRRASRARLAVFYEIEQQRFVAPYDLMLSEIDISHLSRLPIRWHSASTTGRV